MCIQENYSGPPHTRATPIGASLNQGLPTPGPWSAKLRLLHTKATLNLGHPQSGQPSTGSTKTLVSPQTGSSPSQDYPQPGLPPNRTAQSWPPTIAQNRRPEPEPPSLPPIQGPQLENQNRDHKSYRSIKPKGPQTRTPI